MSPKASIVIPAYNMKGKLKKNLQALSSQTERDFEVIVVDDGSTDGTSEWLKDLKSFLNLSFIRHSENRGRAHARNSGVRSARGEVVILLDADMVVTPHFVEKHLSLHREEKVVVIGRVLVAPWAGESAISRYLETRGAHRFRTTIPPFRCFATGNVSIGRGFLLDTGLFDEEMRAYGLEDLELGYRLFKKGAIFVYGEGAVSYHNHWYELEDVLERVRLSGESSVPTLLGKHPELKKTLRLDLLEPVSLRKDSPRVVLRKLVLSLFLREGSYLLVKAVVKKWPGSYLPPPVFDYLLFYNRAVGFQQGATRNHL